jgi:NTP pyrophosphatase (non-canonical NTP hydrolase)
MNSAYKLWTEYTQHVEQTLGDFKDLTPTVLTYGIASELTEVFDVSQKEITKGLAMGSLRKERTSELGDLLWYVAAFERWYNLPHPRYASFMGSSFEISGESGVNLLSTHGEALLWASNISTAMVSGDLDELQYNLNKLMLTVFDICMVYGISMRECMEASMTKMGIRHPEGFDKNAKKDYGAEYSASQEKIKLKGVAEVLYTLNLDSEQKKPYQSITMNAFGKDVIFDSGDGVVDFVSAGDYLARVHPEDEYLVNYSPNFREMLDRVVKDLTMGYIVGEELVTARAMRERMKHKTEGNTIYLGKEGRPILMYNKMKTLDHLFQYIARIKAKIKEDIKK